MPFSAAVSYTHLVLGGAIVDGGKFDWMAHADKFPGLCTPDDSYHCLLYTSGREIFPCVRHSFDPMG